MRPGSVQPGEFYKIIDDSAMSELGLDPDPEQKSVVQIAKWQPEVNFQLDTEPGQHAAIIVYFTSVPTDGTNMVLTVRDEDGRTGGCIVPKYFEKIDLKICVL